jgi:RNA polymerase sigma factor (sigma-70 family)
MHETPAPDPLEPDPSQQHAQGSTVPDPLERLRNVDIEDLMARLLVVAEGMCWYQLRSYRNAPEPRDLVQQAAADVLDGVRQWPDHVDAYTILYGVMRSHVSNFAARQRPVGSSRKKQSGEGTRHVGLEDAPALQNQTSAPDVNVLSEELREHIRRWVEGDDELEQMVEVLFEDPQCSASDLAEEMELTVREVYNARKRLRRRLESLRP